MIVTEDFAEILREYRKAHFLTQKQMAELIGIAPNSIGVLESGKKKPRASTIAAFEAAVREIRWCPDGSLMTTEENELKAYDRLWKQIGRLEAERKQEVLETFYRILRCR